MGSILSEMALDLKLSAVKTVGGFLRESSAIGDGEARVAKLEEYVRILEEEKRKIEAFKRELPLCMLLVASVIREMKEEVEQCRRDRYAWPMVEEFIPVKRNKLEEEEEGEAKVDADSRDKKNWMSSAQLWSDNYSDCDAVNSKKTSLERAEEQSDRRPEKENLSLESKTRTGGGAFIPFEVSSAPRKEEKPTGPTPDLSLLSPAVKSARPVTAVPSDNFLSVSPSAKAIGRTPVSSSVSSGLSLHAQQQPPRKARRCWSPELHRRFILALQQLGGAQVATPKQIREMMKVDGLTNDEVKSHLQKYRLHTQRTPNSSAQSNRPVVVVGGLWVPQGLYTAASSQQSASPSGSPQSPLQLTGASRAISVTAGDSYDEEDGKSESYSWK